MFFDDYKAPGTLLNIASSGSHNQPGTGMFLSALLKGNLTLRWLADLAWVTPPSRVKPRAFPRTQKLPESGVEAFLQLGITNAQAYPDSFHIQYIQSDSLGVGRGLFKAPRGREALH